VPWAVLVAVCASDRPAVLDLVTDIDVFGSYARGAAEPGDVDLN
jgi:predicted nucleotidyltransferase